MLNFAKLTKREITLTGNSVMKPSVLCACCGGLGLCGEQSIGNAGTQAASRNKNGNTGWKNIKSPRKRLDVGRISNERNELVK